mgnify:FL=1
MNLGLKGFTIALVSAFTPKQVRQYKHYDEWERTLKGKESKWGYSHE